MNDLISKLSEIRSNYNCFGEDEEPYYRVLSEAIKILSQRADGDTISRQSAIKAIHEVMLGLFDFTDDDIEEPMTYTEVMFLHINKVIAEKIKALPTAQPETAERTAKSVQNVLDSDLISRKAAIKAICEDGTWLESQGCTEITMAERKQRDADILDELPSAKPEVLACGEGELSAQPERKKGKWTDNNACPFCGFQPWYERDIHTLSFCPNCGADMRGKQDDQ